MKLKLLAKVDLPREKLQKYGVTKLAEHELLAILLGSGIKDVNVLQLSKKILQVILKIGVETISIEDLLKIKGLGQAKASQVIAVIELGKRLSTNRNPEILSAQDIWNMCMDFRESKKEHFVAFYLDTQNRLIERQIISIGTLNSSMVHPREVFEPAIKLSAASIIVVHNHPSNILEPSTEDKEITKRLVSSGKILGVKIIEHIIVSKISYKKITID